MIRLGECDNDNTKKTKLLHHDISHSHENAGEMYWIQLFWELKKMGVLGYTEGWDSIPDAFGEEGTKQGPHIWPCMDVLPVYCNQQE